MNGTNRAATFSAKCANSGFSAWARSNNRIIDANIVLSPTFSTCMVKGLSILTVPPTTLSPCCLVQGKDSPVNKDSLVLLRPSNTKPSAGTISPGLINTASPGINWLTGTTSCSPLRIRVAVAGIRRTNSSAT